MPRQIPMNISGRPSHLKIPGGLKKAHAAISKRAIDRPNVSKLT